MPIGARSRQTWATVVKAGRAPCGCAWQLLRIAKLRTRDQRRADWRSLRLLELFLMFLLWQHWVCVRTPPPLAIAHSSTHTLAGAHASGIGAHARWDLG